MEWFLYTKGLRVVYPWRVAVVVILAALVAIFGWIEVLGRIASMIAVVAFVAMLYGIWLLGKKGVSWSRRKLAEGNIEKRAKLFEEEDAGRRGTSTVKMVAQYVIAKKRHICPYIILPQRSRAYSA